MKKSTTVKLVAFAAMVVVVVVLAFALRTTTIVDCDDCGGNGYVCAYTCNACEGTGEIDDEDCAVCGGVGGMETSECETCGGSGQVAASSWYYKTFMALVPPIIAIVLALITKEVYSSLFFGIIAGALLYANFQPVGALNTLLNDGLIASLADSWNVGILIFLVLLGILVAWMNKAGGSRAFGRWAQKHVRSRVGAQLATFVLGVLIFVDDYFNCLTVGSVMRPLSDSHKVSRAKLAYLIDPTAAPMCMIAPISSWAAAVSGVVEGQNGLTLFISAIPYNFYSLLTIVMIIALTLMKFDYGPMRAHELRAMQGDLFSEGERAAEAKDEFEGISDRGVVLDLIIPVLVLIVCCVLGMIYTGGFFDGVSFVDSFANSDASLGLSMGALVALLIDVIYLVARRTLAFKDAMECIPKGFVAMVPAILILTMAWTLNGMTSSLGADVFVAELVETSPAGLANFLPAIIFLIAVGLSFATGTSWGTFSILIPIVVSVFAGQGEILTIGISACLAGAVCGDHCSPISDTTIMASAGAQCNHVNHVSTQLPYALTVAAVSFVGYLLAGFIQNWMIVLPIMVVVMLLVLFCIRQTVSDKKTA